MRHVTGTSVPQPPMISILITSLSPNWRAGDRRMIGRKPTLDDVVLRDQTTAKYSRCENRKRSDAEYPMNQVRQLNLLVSLKIPAGSNVAGPFASSDFGLSVLPFDLAVAEGNLLEWNCFSVARTAGTK